MVRPGYENEMAETLAKADLANAKGDHRTLVELYKRLDEIGVGLVTARIGEMYECGGIGLDKDFGEATYWYRKAVNDSDDPLAHLGLGRIYFEGNVDIDRDLGKSKYHLQKAYDNDLPQAGIHLGIMSMFGEGTQKNLVDAERFFLTAAAAGYPIAYIYLSNIAASSGHWAKALKMLIWEMILTLKLKLIDRNHPKLWSLPRS